MRDYIVVKYERVDIRSLADPEGKAVPGPLDEAIIAGAASPRKAITDVADEKGGGFYSAFRVPDVTPVRVEMVIDE